MSLHPVDLTVLKSYFALVLPVLIGFFSKCCGALRVGLGIPATMSFTGWTIAYSNGLVDYPFDLYYTGLLGNIVMFAVAFGSSFLVRRQPNPDDAVKH